MFCNNAGAIIRAAPEHVRPVSAAEARLIPLTMPEIINLESSVQPQSQSNRMNNPHDQELPNQNPQMPEPIIIPDAPEQSTSNRST